MNRLALLALALSVASFAPIARADSLDECVDAAVTLLEGGGAHRVQTTRGFLVEGEAHTEMARLERADCAGFLVVGHSRVQDLDLSLFTATGLQLARDVALEPFAYARFCGAAGLELAVTTQMYKGQGEYIVTQLANAPQMLPDLNQAVGQCFASATSTRQRGADIGPEPRGVSSTEGLEALTRGLEASGYSAPRTIGSGILAERANVAVQVPLVANRCYALAAVAGGAVQDLDLFVLDVEGRMIARDLSRDRDAVVKVCASVSGDHRLDLRTIAGEGEYTLAVLDLREPATLPIGVSGSSRIPYAETVAQLESAGMRVEPIAWGLVAPGEALAMPIDVVADHCVAFAGVPSNELDGADLDLLLLDEEGNLLAWNLSAGPTPVLYHCPQANGSLRLIGRVYGARGRYLALVGREAPSGAPRP